MKKSFPWSSSEVVLTVALSALLIGVMISDKTPSWLRALAGALVFVGPFVPVLALLPWHFVAKRQGLISRSQIPCVLLMDDDGLLVDRGGKRLHYAWSRVARVRWARNDNWTESKMLEDAAGLFDERGREFERIPESARGFAMLMEAFTARKIPVEIVLVSAPAILD